MFVLRRNCECIQVQFVSLFRLFHCELLVSDKWDYTHLFSGLLREQVRILLEVEEAVAALARGLHQVAVGTELLDHVVGRVV